MGSRFAQSHSGPAQQTVRNRVDRPSQRLTVLTAAPLSNTQRRHRGGGGAMIDGKRKACPFCMFVVSVRVAPVAFSLLDLGGDPEDTTGYNGRAYYRLATITWSDPVEWDPRERRFPVPAGWAGHGGVYAFIRDHGRQTNPRRVAYIGKAVSFERRLINTHNHFDIVKRRGRTLVSCGRIVFDRTHSRVGYYLEIEDIIKFAIHDWLENSQGFETLPGFRSAQPRAMFPWVIANKGYNFEGHMPKRIAYPAFAVSRSWHQ